MNLAATGRKALIARQGMPAMALLFAAMATCFAQDDVTPANVRFLEAPLVLTSTAASTSGPYGSNLTHSINVPGYALPPEFAALARGLGKDNVTTDIYAQRVNEYVYNNIKTDFMFGLQKGAYGAMLDQSGTPFDQAQLVGALLKQAPAPGISVTYKIGSITLTGAQFTGWTGISNAAVACQLMAKGGIPATINGSSNTNCSSYSGTVSSVQMLHVWVSAVTSAGTRLLDPSFKVLNTPSTPIDLAVAMGCGTQSSPTCGSAATNALMTGANNSYLTGSIPAFNTLNQTALENTLKNSAINLQSTLQNSYPHATLQQILGLRTINSSGLAAPSASLPYGTPSAVWSASDIPDQFRTRLTVSADDMTVPLFADELTGRRLRLWGTTNGGNTSVTTRQYGLMLEYQLLASSSSNPNGTVANSTLALSVDHPYAANGGTYMDETNQSTGIQRYVAPITTYNQNGSTTTTYTGPGGARFFIWKTDIVLAFGRIGQGTSANASELASADEYKMGNYPFFPTWPNTNPFPNCSGFTNVGAERLVTCANLGSYPLWTEWLAQSSQMTDVIEGVNQTLVQRHHYLGVALANEDWDTFGVGGTILNIGGSMSVVSLANTAADVRATVYSTATGMSRLEGGVVEQGGQWEGSSAPSLFGRYNYKGASFALLSSTADWASASGYLSGYSGDGWAQTNIQNYLQNGYKVLLPTSWTPPTYQFCPQQMGGTGPDCSFATLTLPVNQPLVAFHPGADPTIPDRVEFVVGGRYKGAGGAGSTDLAMSNVNVKPQDYSAKNRKFYGVDVNTGSLQLKPPADMVTGAGDFPHSLPVTRYYDSSRRSILAKHSVNAWHPDSYPITLDDSRFYVSSDPLVGSGWKLNWEIKRRFTSDVRRGMGEESALDASAALAALYTSRTLALSEPDLTGNRNLATIIYSMNWFGSQLNLNAVIVERPPRNDTFVRLPDGRFNGPPNVGDVLTQSGTFAGPFIGARGTPTGKYGSGWIPTYSILGINLALTGGDGSVLSFSGTPVLNDEIVAGPASWNFPDGTQLTFAYETRALDLCNGCGEGQAIGVYLKSVTSNLGRALNFGGTQALDHGSMVTTVVDENGRAVTYTQTGSGEYDIVPVALGGVRKLEVVTPDGANTQYEYSSNITDTAATRLRNIISKVYSPTNHSSPFLTINYDGLFRVASVVDAVGVSTQYLSGQVGFQENLHRGDTINQLGGNTTEYFGQFGLKLSEIDPMGLTTWFTYDGGRRLTKKTLPLGNAESYTYDVRNNLLTTTLVPISGSALPSIVTQTLSYPEGTGVYVCTTPATCNKPATVQDSKSNTTTYTYYTNSSGAATGQLQRIRGPAVTGGNAQTDFCYATYSVSGGAVSLLSGKIDKEGSTANRVTSYAYDSNNKYVLNNATTDPDTTWVPPAAAGSDCTTTSKAGALALSTNFTSDPIGNVTRIDGPRTDVSDISTYTFDSMRRLTRTDAQATSVSLDENIVNAYESYLFGAADHLISLDPNEGPANGYTSQGVKFKVLNVQRAGMIPLYRCYQGGTRNNHWVSTNSGCEAGFAPESTYGYVYTTPVDGTVPLYRFILQSNGDSLATTNFNEGPTFGFSYEGLLGYVLAPDATTFAAPAGPATRYTYDADGLLRTTRRAVAYDPADSDPSNPWPADLVDSQWQTETRNYYANGDLMSVTDAESHVTQYKYDVVGRTTLVTDPDNRRTGTVYDLAGKVLCTWKAWNSTTAPTNCTWTPPATYTSGPFRYAAYTYTANGKQASVQDANANQTDFVYDKLDRLRFNFFPSDTTGSRCTAPSGETGTPSCPTGATYEELWYTTTGAPTAARCSANNQLCRKRMRNGQIVTYNTYDAMDRLITKTPQSQGAVTYAYNLLSEPTSVSEVASGSYYAAHTTTYGYDGAGRKSNETNDSRQVSYQYDEAGNRSRTTWPDGYFVAYQYDALNRMQYVRENSTSANELAFYDYDILSRRTKLRFAANESNKATYSYEADSNLDLLTQVMNATTVSLDYGHNNSGQITSIAANDDFYLAKPATPVTRAYVPDKLNRYASVGGQAATYDASGNMLTRFPLDGSGKDTFTYDSENRLVSAAVDGGNPVTIRYDYDALGRRQKKTVGSTVTQYLLDGDEEIAELSSTGTVLRRYITGPSIDDRIARAEGSATSNPTKTYYRVNHQGSVVATTDSSGASTQTLAYNEYGLLASTAVTTGEQFRYTGRRFDPETGLYYYRARYYAPDFGRFLQTDPIGYDGDLNLYSYVDSDPANHTDATGQFVDVIVDAGFIAYDAYSLITEPSWTSAAALGLDVIGAAVPFVTGLGEAYRAGNKLVDVAAAAEKGVAKTGNAAVDGTKIHTQFDKALQGGAVKNVAGETAYKNGHRFDAYRPKGSSNPDAVVGNPNKPTAAFDLKTGKAGISKAQAAKAEKNLPSGTPLYEVRSTGHNVPHPSTASRAGAGATANAICNSTEKDCE